MIDVSSEEEQNVVPDCVSEDPDAIFVTRHDLKRHASQPSLSETAAFSQKVLENTGSRVADVDSTAGRLSHKRQRQHRGIIERRAISAIEDLPAEILQSIFFKACNGNLLLAAPRIAVRLSGIESIYAATFAIAFYSHQLEEVLGLFNLKHWTSTIPLPYRVWQIRSMTKAVLGSRWCTCEWVRDFMTQLKSRFLLDTQKTLDSSEDFAGYHDLEVKAAADLDEEIDKVCKRTSRLQGPLHPLLAEDFDLQLKLEDIPRHEDVDEEEEHLQHFDFSPPWVDLVFRRMIWKFCTATTLGTYYGLDSYQPNAPFRIMVQGEVGQLRYLNIDPFAQMQDAYRRQCCDNWGGISDRVAVDYYSHPEDHPFKIDPSVFRIAALSDMRFTCDKYCWARFVRLFSADPTSLPRTDPVIIAYANHVAHRIRRMKLKIVKTRYWMRQLRRDGVMTAKYRQLACDWYHEDFCRLHLRDFSILGYICTGEKHFLPNRNQLSPAIHHHCEAHMTCLESEYMADDNEGTLEEMKEALAKTIKYSCPTLDLFKESSFFRSKEEIAHILEEYSDCYLDPNPPDNDTRIKWPTFRGQGPGIRCQARK
ncbi:hypothetical protein H2200_000179 [Cladophialophora chaetospira]|uniref:Uncharacterized protein n=1 Tax=Cladophialophora chaetospira TaxID=386627 RepID=A0AA38XNT1_9EURO|nr:hypothetical protein H2200_000179 [Cladophialophora chaetospira]